MNVKTVLVVDDEEAILELVELHLRREGLAVLLAGTGEEALQMLRSQAVDLVVLDLMLPGINGLEVCRRMRSSEAMTPIPVLMLSARSDETDIVVGLELGADDYVTKPFLPKVLIARVRALLRRSGVGASQGTADLLSYGGLLVDLQRHRATLDGAPLDLTATEFALLCLFISHPGWVFTRNQIIARIKGDDYPVTDRSVDVQVVGLRRKLGRLAESIETVRGVGYRIRENA
ncbi:response regulator transcription factor [Myxococcota bacterium]|nr:response regulator transcription factor [Myxococcota bacterium]MBU1412094.1 response regulator transcription factor [Myxococcota bacterium]MBU1510034.1 response regulator transcription factor [Myxococcota bacterium]